MPIRHVNKIDMWDYVRIMGESMLNMQSNEKYHLLSFLV